MRGHHHRQQRQHQRAAAAPDAVYWQQHHARGALAGDSSGEDDAESQLPSQRRKPQLIFQFKPAGVRRGRRAAAACAQQEPAAAYLAPLLPSKPLSQRQRPAQGRVLCETDPTQAAGHAYCAVSLCWCQGVRKQSYCSCWVDAHLLPPASWQRLQHVYLEAITNA
jgi:hypothetical protein